MSKTLVMAVVDVNIEELKCFADIDKHNKNVILHSLTGNVSRDTIVIGNLFDKLLKVRKKKYDINEEEIL